MVAAYGAADGLGHEAPAGVRRRDEQYADVLAQAVPHVRAAYDVGHLVADVASLIGHALKAVGHRQQGEQQRHV